MRVVEIKTGKNFTPATDKEYFWLTIQLENNKQKYIAFACEDGKCESGIVANAFQAMATELRK